MFCFRSILSWLSLSVLHEHTSKLGMENEVKEHFYFRQEARALILSKNPDAFRFHQIVSGDSLESVIEWNCYNFERMQLQKEQLFERLL